MSEILIIIGAGAIGFGLAQVVIKALNACMDKKATINIIKDLERANERLRSQIELLTDEIIELLKK